MWHNFLKNLKNVPFEVDWAFLTSKGSVFSRFGPPRSLENPAAAISGSRIFTKTAFGAQDRPRGIIFRLLAIENRVPNFCFRLFVDFSQFWASQHGLHFGLKMALDELLVAFLEGRQKMGSIIVSKMKPFPKGQKTFSKHSKTDLLKLRARF